MSYNFDVAIGSKSDALNQGAKALFDDADTNKKIFQGSIKKDVKDIGSVVFTYKANAAPTFVLAAPTQAEWDKATKEVKDAPLPTSNVFQILFSDVTASVTVGTSAPVNGTGPFVAYAVVSNNSGKLTLDVQAVYIDMAKFSAFDKWMFSNLFIPKALTMVDQVLSSIQLPGLPAIEGVSFNPAEVNIANSLLLITATTTTNTKPVDIGDFKWPTSKPYFALLSHGLLSTLASNGIQKNVSGQTFSGSKEKGKKGLAQATLDYSGKINSATAAVSSTDLTQITLSIDPSLKATGKISGWAALAACPVGGALNAL